MRTVLITLFLAAAAVSPAAPYTGETWAFLDTKKALDAAAEITLEKYPDCDSATIEKKPLYKK